MKLNLDCIRDILLESEKLLPNEYISLNGLLEAIPQYSENDVVYSCLKLDEAGFINATISRADDQIYLLIINDLTFNGHQFLQDISRDDNWFKVKDVAKKVGSLSLSVLTNIASKVTISNIDKFF